MIGTFLVVHELIIGSVRYRIQVKRSRHQATKKLCLVSNLYDTGADFPDKYLSCRMFG